MKLFAVFKEGIYRHECLGIFDLQPVAEAQAIEAAEHDIDDHHTYRVVPFELNKPTAMGSADWTGPGYNENPHVFEVKHPPKTERKSGLVK